MQKKARMTKRRDDAIASLITDLVGGASEEEIHLLMEAQRGNSQEYAAASRKAVSSALETAQAAGRQRQQSVIAAEDDIKWDRFPLKEMYKRNWFEGFSGSLDVLRANAEEILSSFVQHAMPRRRPALLRKRAHYNTSRENPYCLLAWQCRVLALAKDIELPTKYARDVITEEWFLRLVRESPFANGPQRAVKYLKQAGIRLIIEAHLPQTYLDGAAFLLPDGSPVIGLTLRCDRLDNFWFVLLHELAHVVKHLRRARLEDIFDYIPDIPEEQPDTLEQEANHLAQAMLIPGDVWETALPRYVQSEESVCEFAEEIGINPAIVAGRIRKESSNYYILGDLIGQGKVRRQFPGIPFAQ